MTSHTINAACSNVIFSRLNRLSHSSTRAILASYRAQLERTAGSACANLLGLGANGTVPKCVSIGDFCPKIVSLGRKSTSPEGLSQYCVPITTRASQTSVPEVSFLEWCPKARTPLLVYFRLSSVPCRIWSVPFWKYVPQPERPFLWISNYPVSLLGFEVYLFGMVSQGQNVHSCVFPGSQSSRLVYMCPLLPSVTFLWSYYVVIVIVMTWRSDNEWWVDSVCLCKYGCSL